MKKSTSTSIKLGENHRRSISVTLQLVDQALCEWDDWARGKVRTGIMYQEQDTLSTVQKNELRAKITKLRQLIARLRDDLQLKPKSLPTSQSILGQASLLWEMLTDLNSRGLQGYGKVSEGLAHYLDPIADQLSLDVNEIARFFSRLISPK